MTPMMKFLTCIGPKHYRYLKLTYDDGSHIYLPEYKTGDTGKWESATHIPCSTLDQALEAIDNMKLADTAEYLVDAIMVNVE